MIMVKVKVKVKVIVIFIGTHIRLPQNVVKKSNKQGLHNKSYFQGLGQGHGHGHGHGQGQGHGHGPWHLDKVS